MYKQSGPPAAAADADQRPTETPKLMKNNDFLRIGPSLSSRLCVLQLAACLLLLLGAHEPSWHTHKKLTVRRIWLGPTLKPIWLRFAIPSNMGSSTTRGQLPKMRLLAGFPSKNEGYSLAFPQKTPLFFEGTPASNARSGAHRGPARSKIEAETNVKRQKRNQRQQHKRFLSIFGRRRCVASCSRMMSGGSGTRNLCSHYSGSTIFSHAKF